MRDDNDNFLVEQIIGSNPPTFEYTGGGTDNWGDAWAPDEYNIMSYSRPEARERFSPMQIGMIYFWVIGNVSPLIIPPSQLLHNQNEFVDIYEPDNFNFQENIPANIHLINFGEPQHRGLHAVKSGLRTNPNYTYCDEDYVRFTVPGNTSYKVNIATHAVDGAQQVDTEIFLFEDDGTTLLTNNDDKATGDIYSKISEHELAPGDYWIQVVSNGNTRGEYTLSLDYCEVECCFQPLLGSETVVNSATGPFNLGAMLEGKKEFFGNSVTVTGEMGFNDNIQLGFGEPYFPLNNSELEAEICNNALINITGTGQMVLGSSSTGRTANVRFLDGTVLELNPFAIITIESGSELIIDSGAEFRLNGGILRVMDGGNVTIKAGGKLIYEAGAQIELNGNDAVLSLGGLTHIGDDATFTFTYQGNESGYIRMLDEGYWGERFSAGINASVKLQGENKDDLILYMEENVNFWEFAPTSPIPGENYISQKFDQVIFKDGKIIMEDDARIVLLNKSWFMRTTVESLDISHHPRGITPLTSCYISASTLNRMKVDAQLFYSGAGTLYIGTSIVNNSYVYVRGYGYHLQSCSFYNSEIFSYDTPMGNTILRSTFTNSGIAVEDDSDSELFVYQSDFYGNGIGVRKRRGRLTAKCNKFEGNNTAISGNEASEINISTLYNGGYNYFSNNALNIWLYNAYGLQMEDGYNEFYDGTSMNIEGNLDISMSLCVYPIKAYNNTWTPLSDTSVPYGDLNHPDMAEFKVVIGQPVGPIWAQNCPVKFSFGPVAPITECGRYDDPKGPGDPIIIIEGPKSNGSQNEFPLLTSPTYFTDTPFDYALKVAAYTTTVADTLNGDDLLAADKYYEFLYLAEMDTLPNDSMAIVIEKMRWASLNNYKATIERLFTDSVLLRSNNQNNFDPTVQNYVTVLMAFTDSIKTAENYKQQFQLELWKAALMKMIGKKEQALHIISNINYCDHDSLQRIILLEQIQNLEFEISRSQIDLTTFLSDSVTFVLDSAIYEIPLDNYIDTTGFGSYILSPNSILFSSCNTSSARPFHQSLNDSGVNVVLYPNPTQNYVNISFLDKYPDVESILTLHIFELTGKEVFNAQLSPQNSRVNLPALANALYLYRLELDDKLIDQGKLSIIE